MVYLACKLKIPRSQKKTFIQEHMARSTLVSEVIRYRLVQVCQNLNEKERSGCRRPSESSGFCRSGIPKYLGIEVATKRKVTSILKWSMPGEELDQSFSLLLVKKKQKWARKVAYTPPVVSHLVLAGSQMIAPVDQPTSSIRIYSFAPMSY